MQWRITPLIPLPFPPPFYPTLSKSLQKLLVPK